jgi:two-component system cell cycle sensor histidine kinase/response regulator CckA
MSQERETNAAARAINGRHYRELITSLPEGVGITDLNETLVFANREFASMLGYEVEEFVGKNLRDLLAEKEIGIVQAETARRQLGISSAYDLRMIRKDGGRITVRVSAVPRRDEHDNVIGTIAVVSDITIEKEREMELLKLQRAVDASPTSIVITDSGGIIEYVNPKFSELTGYAFNEAIGTNPRILKSGKTPLEVYEDLWKTIKSGKIWRGRFVNKKKNGEHYWEDAWISPVRGRTGDITHFVAVKEDITRNVIAEEKLRNSYQDLELYASFLSHDIRNDLQILMNYADAALTLVKDNSQAHEYIGNVQAASERMVNLLDVFGRPAEEDETDIIKIIAKTAVQAEKAHPGLKINLGTSEKDAKTRSARLMPIVFDNLFRNAAEFSLGDVRVDIHVCRKNNMICVEVHDNGPGISEEIKPKLFTKGASSTGGGYGLYLTRKVIEAYGGSIELMEKEDHEGASFLIKLPAKE